ncbi:MAG TPA: hypothetical protein VJ826_16090 [Candidatus Polarisedimenticolaceae bacterium]|nr:hypothetical protein [Candidatus Polarisedimenticolaceae bacterium]
MALVSLIAFGCGGNKPAEQAQATATPTPETAQPSEQAPPAAAPVEPAPEQHQQQAQTSKPKPTTPKTEVAQSAPPPAPAPAKPEPIVKTLAPGTELQVTLETPVSSKTSQVGDAVTARVSQPLVIDGMTAIPEGASVAGTITEAVPVKKIGGAASVGVRFDAIQLHGETVVINASIQQKAKSETGKDAGTIAGATAAGAILGRVLSKHDKTKGTVIGAVVGGAAGTGAAVATKGKEVEFAAGTPFVLKLEDATNVTVQR